MIKKTMFVGILFLGFTCQANVELFRAEISQSVWMTSGDKLFCKLEHEIPEYGKLIFKQMAGESENLTLNVFYGRGLIRELGEINFMAPDWKVREESKDGFKFRFKDKNEKIVFSSRQARQVLDALDHGYQPTIVHRDSTDLRRLIHAQASPANFNDMYKKYTICQANLIPYSFDDIRNSSVYFTTGSVRLDDEAKKWLEYVLEYARDPAFRRIELGGFTDSVGSFRANHKLASSRVEEVQKYLMAAGINEKQIKLRVYGEQRAQHSNKTAEGRRMNRRVSIRVLR